MEDKIVTIQNYGYSDSDYAKFRKFASRMLWGFVIMYFFFYNGRQNMSLAIALMMEDMNATKAQMGLVTSALFWCYGFGHLFSGRLGEVVGNKRYMMIGVILSIMLNLIIGFQNSLIAIAVLWGLNGFAQSTAWSPGIALSSKWWPKEKRGFASGVMTGSSGLAQVVTYGCVLLAFTMSPEMGWRAAFRWPMIPMVIGLTVFLLLVKALPSDVGLEDFREPDAEAAALEASRMKDLESKGALYPYICLLREPKMCVFLVVIAIGGIGRYGMLTWVPTYFLETMNMDIKSGIFASVLLPLGQAAAFFLMPYLTDKVFKGKREPLLVICGVVSAVSLIIFPLITTQVAASFMLFAVGFFSSVNGIVWAFAGDIGTRAFAGTATGLLDWAAYMGAAVQSILFGYVSSYSWSFVFFTIAGLYVLLIIMAFAAQKMKVRGIAK